VSGGQNIVSIIVQADNETGAGFGEASASAEELAANVDGAMSDYVDAVERAQQANARLAELQKDDAASADDLAAAQDRLTEASLRSMDAQMRLIEAERAEAAAVAQAGDAQEDLAVKTDATAASSEESAGLLAGFGSTAKMALLGVGAALAYGTVKAAGFQSELLTLHTQAGVAKSQLASLGNGVLSLAGQVGDGPDSLVEALYHIESSFASVGIKGPQALNLLKTAAEGAAVGHANLTDVTNALDATIVAGVPGIRSFGQAMGELNAIVGSGDMTMQNLADAMGTGVMAVAKSYGQSITQVGAALAVFGDNNIRGAQAATELRMAWQAMQAPLTTAGPVLKSIGLSMTELGHTMTHQGMSAAIQEFVDRLKASKVPAADWGQYMTEIFGKKAGVGIALLVDQLSRLKSKFPDLKAGADDFGKAVAANNATAAQQWKDLTAALQAMVTKMGEAFLPAAEKAVRALTDLAEWMTRNKGTADALGAVIGGVLAVMVGGKLVGAVSDAKGAIEGLFSVIGKIPGAISGIGSAFSAIGSGFASAASSVASFTAGMARQLAEAAAATAAWIAEHAAAAASFIAENLAMAASATAAFIAENAATLGLVAAIAALVAGIIYLATHWQQAWGAVKSAALDAWRFLDGDVIHPIQQGIAGLVSWIESHWKLLATILATALLGPVGGLVVFIATHWAQFRQLTSELIDDVVRFFEQLPGRIMSALAALPSMMFSAGVHVIRSLLDGITSMIGEVGSTMGHLASKVAGFFGLSPAKEGPLSGGGAPEIRGQHFAASFAAGMESGQAGVAAAAARLAGSAGISPGGSLAGYGGAAAGGGMNITIQITPNGAGGLDQLFMQWLKGEVRTSGGDPNMFTRKVKFQGQ